MQTRTSQSGQSSVTTLTSLSERYPKLSMNFRYGRDRTMKETNHSKRRSAPRKTTPRELNQQQTMENRNDSFRKQPKKNRSEQDAVKTTRTLSERCPTRNMNSQNGCGQMTEETSQSELKSAPRKTILRALSQRPTSESQCDTFRRPTARNRSVKNSVRLMMNPSERYPKPNMNSGTGRDRTMGMKNRNGQSSAPRTTNHCASSRPTATKNQNDSFRIQTIASRSGQNSVMAMTSLSECYPKRNMNLRDEHVRMMEGTNQSE